LDSFKEWNKLIENNGDLEFLDKQLNELVSKYC
jgi:hypothetical protein